MIKRTVRQIAEMADGQCLKPEWENMVVSGVSTDTRTIQAGNLYVPLRGATFNGHDFVQEAAQKRSRRRTLGGKGRNAAGRCASGRCG